MIFRTPSRRKTRQRSGFNVAGETPGSECKIKNSLNLDIEKREFEFNFKRKDLAITPLFQDEVGLIFFGGYIKPDNDIKVTIKLKYILESTTEDITKTFQLTHAIWNKLGLVYEIKIIENTKIDFLLCNIKLTSDKNIGKINIFGFNMGVIGYDYFLKNDVKDIFYEKLNIYIPEISYERYDEPFLIAPIEKIHFESGDAIILKSCNRCSRFLPIDILNERNTLSFSNHCVKKVPCAHSAFSTYNILNSDYKDIPKAISHLLVDGKLRLYNGYQLECKSCKKFFVNAPLNPLRNSTQHREDSLRRRAIEVLTDTLLKRQWIYHEFRLKEKKEFDRFIWEKFGKKCFKCNKELETEKDMDLDHTMPLASFWPLDETATCLCNKCNSLKSDKFPIEFYSERELTNLSKITGLDLNTLKSKKINLEVIERLINNVDWFFEDFLNNKDYQKVRGGKRTSDLIYKAIMKQLNTFYKKDIDLVEIYKKKTGKLPTTITT